MTLPKTEVQEQLEYKGKKKSKDVAGNSIRSKTFDTTGECTSSMNYSINECNKENIHT